ncbi:nitrite reductase small subunit NirD [Paludibacterium yongneupense]|uniref:nitrite reductase small subunit NirD n=1 Tax=Paludibacterium yongneupense TaxID=400061 RepID=UPI00040B1A7A|nr:nitrite reductase small subunit NirD [Paludibacterium yongneupense]
MMHWQAICRLDEIPLRGSRVVKREGEVDIAVFRCADDRVFALADRCPHKGGPLSQGIVSGHKVSCPLHGMQLGLEEGRALEPDEGCVGRFPVRVVDGRVELDTTPIAP